MVGDGTMRLRMLLDDMGVEHVDDDDNVTVVHLDDRQIQYYEMVDTFTMRAVFPDYSKTDARPLTYKDAIAKTLGMVCERKRSGTQSGPRYMCSNCNYGASDKRWNYCPKCGRKYA